MIQETVEKILKLSNLASGIPFQYDRLVGTQQSFAHLLYNIIRDCKIKRALEWGPGFSTWVSLKASSDLDLYSYESESEWVEYYGNMFKSIVPELVPRIRMTFEPNKHMYVETLFCDEWFDLILVDGIERQGCLDRAYDLVKPGGVVLLHDSHTKKVTMKRDLHFIGTHKALDCAELTDVWVKRER